MTKAELVNTISDKLGTEKGETQKIVEAFMHEIRSSLYQGENVYFNTIQGWRIGKAQADAPAAQAFAPATNLNEEEAYDLPF